MLVYEGPLSPAKTSHSMYEPISKCFLQAFFIFSNVNDSYLNGQLIVDQHVHIFGISLQPQLLAFGLLNTQRNLVTFLPSCGVFGRVVACSLPICDSFVQTCCQCERTCSKYIKIFPNDLLGPAWKITACRPWHSWSAKFLIFLIFQVFNFIFIKIKMYQNRNCIKFTKVKDKK